MSEPWYEQALRNDPNDGAARAARFRERRGRQTDEFVSTLEKSAETAPNWWQKLPRNMGIGVYKAALNAIETGADIADVLAAGAQHAERVEEGSKTGVDKPPLQLKPARDLAPEFFDSAHALGAEWSAGNTLGDDIVQGVTQFAVPFAAFMRALGGFKRGQQGVNVVRGVAAESATVSGAFDPHEGRLGDVVAMLRESEGRFGDLLRTVAPDGSAANAYIDWISNRENESEAKGRFKNVVDSLVGSAAVAGVIKGAAVGFRKARAKLAPQE